MKRLISLAAAIALLTVADSAFAQQGNKGKDDQRQGQQQDRGARQGGDKGQPQDRGERQRRGQGQQSRGQDGRRGGQGGGSGGLFRLLDTDRDGNLSAKEIDGAVAALMKLDANKDGILDAQELVVRGSGGRGGQGRNRGGDRGSENSERRGGGQGKGSNGKQASEN